MTLSRFLLVFALSVSAFVTPAQAEVAAPTGLTPTELAARAEVIVLAQLIHADYEYRRGFPVGGKAWLRVLIPYRVPRPINALSVHETGIRDGACYFPDVPEWREMPRFLLFLVIDEEGEYRGVPELCKLDVLADADSSRYVVRWPQDGLVLDEDALALVREWNLTGPAARISTEGMTRVGIENRKQHHNMRLDGDDLVYTHGIELGELRALMGGAAEMEDRFLRRRR